MIILLSPAKSLDFESSVSVKTVTEPRFLQQSSKLMKTLRQRSADDLSKLMNISDALAELNFERNQQWKKKHSQKTARPAVYAFQGDVYQGLKVDSLSAKDVRRCQKHVRILSGLYGLLRPLDLIQPYRLEMGTKLKTDAGKNLYEFWGNTVRDAIVSDCQEIKSRLVVNLASAEYSKVARLKEQDISVVTPVFKDWKNGQYKVISFFAKQARGLMARYLVMNSVKKADGINGFDLDGYVHNPELSQKNKPVFTRKA